METPISESSSPEGYSVQGRMADTPRSVGAPNPGFRQSSLGMRKSTVYGVLLFLLQHPDFELSEGQRLWIVYYARKLSEAELLKAGNTSLSLLSNELHRQRMKHEINRLHHSVPSLNPLNLPEKRRIGIGYRDKGALRPLHRPRPEGERTFWDEDILYLLPLSYEVTGKWLTADEVSSLIGVDLLNLVLQQIQKQTLPYVPYQTHTGKPGA